LAERGANQSSKESLVVYPNPATNKVQVELNLSVPADVVLTLRDVTGRLVKQVRLGRLDASVDKVSLDLQGIRPGHHILTVQAGDRVTSSPLVIR
jgi:hypothetical protein